MTRLVLVPSPFVGAVSWQALAGTLPDAAVADYGGVSGPDWYEGAARRITAFAEGHPWIAVLHSGAGGFAPALAAASPDLMGFIHVDSVLPYPGQSCLATAPPAQVDQLKALTTGGRLAAWNTWFEDDPTLRWIPDPEARKTFVDDLPRTPFAFLEAISPVSDWAALPAAYVQLSKGYEATAAKAEQRGWAVRRVRAHHLAMISDPAMVAALLTELTTALDARA